MQNWLQLFWQAVRKYAIFWMLFIQILFSLFTDLFKDYFNIKSFEPREFLSHPKDQS